MSESDTLLHIRIPAEQLSVIEVFSHMIRPMGIIAIAQLAVGALYLFDCPRQPYIPIYLLVMGVTSLLLSVPSASFRKHNESWSNLLSLFFIGWFITGNVWIYTIYEPNYNKTMTSVDPYCNKTLYLFAFWTTNLTYILLGLIFCSCCSCLLCDD